MRRIFGSWSATRRGVKPLLTRPRRCLWAGSSRLIIDGIGGESGRLLPLLQNASGRFESSITSACRVMPQSWFASSQYTGALARIQSKCRCGSVA